MLSVFIMSMEAKKVLFLIRAIAKSIFNRD